MLFLNFRLLISFFISTKSSKVYFMLLILAFAIFSINNLNICHRNFEVKKNHFNFKTFTTVILNINRIRYNYGEMTEITYSHFDQHYSKYIFRNCMSHNLKPAKENVNNVRFYWIKFITSLLFLCRHFYNPKLKVLIIITS